ncbi:sensor domain-containing diguanylate cyclase [Natranaerobius thermophilus]|uniref:Diguanylate cyclase with GAF sensor n=1 Tax=Natranaerobius thermophilus (strain ATCC BAA-1301 / DSM 18059 / JW/NM-WN-LF) TaxID=457570 RepID=B2A8J4_NATTJ|nr:sensor domain-containing diguanylate cyclase [Natranaerobius thermophilus]ACB85878.1 diguanylate cyclase with GAF sensor [Natranaerobius thermophilus JW/NM-WN-LF]
MGKILEKRLNQGVALASSLVLLTLLWITLVNAGYRENVFTYEFIVLLALTIVMERIRIPAGRISLSLNFALVFSALVILGFYPSIWIATVGIAFHSAVFSNRPGSVALFNGAMFGVTFYVAGLAYQQAGGVVGLGEMTGPLPVIIYGLVSLAVNHTILTTYIKFVVSYREYSFSDVLKNVGWDVVTYGVSLPVAVLMIMLYNNIGILGIVVMVMALGLNSYIFRLYKKLDQFHQELHSLQKTSVNLIESMELDDVLQAITRASKTMFDTKKCGIWIYDDKQGFKLTLINGESPERTIILAEGEGITGKVSHRKTPLFINNINHPEWQEAASAEGLYDKEESILVTPLICQNKIIGALSLTRNNFIEHLEKDELIQLTEIFSAQVASALSNALHHQKVEDLAVTDEKTNLYNYRYFYKQLEQAIYDYPERSLTMLMIDIDDFKLYNDRFGHPAGDEVLEIISKLLKDNIRDRDIACRYGGEEFSVLLLGARGIEAEKIAERIRSAIANYPFPGDEKTPKVKLTVSIGGAEYPQDGTSSMDLMRKSDQALYLGSKKQGKNRVSMFKKITELHSVQDDEKKIVGFPNRGVDGNGSNRGDN